MPKWIDHLNHKLRAAEDWWFDTSRRVRTSGLTMTVDPGAIVGDVRDSLPYIPVRVGRGRAALRALHLDSPGDYTFTDIGSGEGRALFIAAEWPFKRIIGVEFVRALHETAEANARTFRHRGARCHDIQPIQADAAAFDFPSGNLVVYLFNPFGPQVLGAVLTKLQEALASEPRRIVVLLQWPVLGRIVRETPGFRPLTTSRRWEIYEADSR